MELRKKTETDDDKAKNKPKVYDNKNKPPNARYCCVCCICTYVTDMCVCLALVI